MPSSPPAPTSATPRCWRRIGGRASGSTADEIATAAGAGRGRRGGRRHTSAPSRSGIAGVPVCVFGDDHVIAGAQPAEVLEALLDLERYRLELAGDGGAHGRHAS